MHVKGYRHELIPLTVARIPSMHICLDFISELLVHESLNVQV
jgi:integrator complex subunit 2